MLMPPYTLMLLFDAAATPRCCFDADADYYAIAFAICLRYAFHYYDAATPAISVIFMPLRRHA